MDLLLCRQERAKHPFYTENLGLNTCSFQELCYILYHHPLLGLDGFINSTLLDFLRNELGLGFTAPKLERWLHGEGDPDEALIILLQERNYYSVVEISQFRQRITALRKMPPAELAKGEADCLFELKQYGKAINIYQDILDVVGEARIDERSLGRVWYNLGSTYARVLRFDKTVGALEQTYEFLKERSMIEELYYLTQFDSGITLREKYRSLISEEEKARQTEKFEETRDLSGHTKELEELDELFIKDSIKRIEGAAAIVRAWKRKYRNMA